MRPRCQVGPKREKVIFELGGTGRGIPAQAGVLLVATTPSPGSRAARRRRALPLFNYRTIETGKGKNVTKKEKCPHPVGYFTIHGDYGQTVKHPAACNCWVCEVCGPKKLRRFLYCLNHAAKTLIGEGHRFRGLTLTLGPGARNEDIGRYWHRFRMSLKKAGYNFQYIWVKEFQKNGKLHLHALITAFIPWNAIKYYWRLATNGTSCIVWIAEAQVQYTAAYIAKYISKDLTTAPFRKGERRYGMSKGLREAWPLLKSSIYEPKKIRYEFIYKPNNHNLMKKAVEELKENNATV